MPRERKSYCAYIMGSLSGTLYIGMTGNLHKRVFDHKFHRIEGFTNKYDVEASVVLGVVRRCPPSDRTRETAEGLAALEKITLIEFVNPHWLDLARDWYPWMNSEGSRGPSTPHDDARCASSCSAQDDRGKTGIARPSTTMDRQQSETLPESKKTSPSATAGSRDDIRGGSVVTSF